jgi:alanine racemase
MRRPWTPYRPYRIGHVKPEHVDAWLEVDLGALLRNARTVAARARVPLLPMVKADAYGLGALPVARALEAIDPWGYGVATLDEGIALRAAGITRAIIVFNPLLADELPAAHAQGLAPTLSEDALIAAWGHLTKNAPWHLMIDTGMSRSGVRWSLVGDLSARVRQFPPLGACTHFYSADADDGSMRVQLERFQSALDALPSRPSVLHAENSAAIERLTGPSLWTFVRPGVFLYGVESRHTASRETASPTAAWHSPATSGGGEQDAVPPLRSEPVVALRARIVDLRWIEPGESVSYGATFRATERRRIATLAAGYADGYRRAFSNLGVALVRGRRVRVAGIVTMDMTMLDVTGLDCAIGDVATLLGVDRPAPGIGTAPSEGRPYDGVDLAGAARAAGLCAYEVLTGLRERVPRVYVGRSHE